MVKRIPLALALWPEVAWACPYCMSNAGDGYVTATILMLALPVVLVGGFAYWLRAASQHNEHESHEVV